MKNPISDIYGSGYYIDLKCERIDVAISIEYQIYIRCAHISLHFKECIDERSSDVARIKLKLIKLLTDNGINLIYDPRYDYMIVAPQYYDRLKNFMNGINKCCFINKKGFIISNIYDYLSGIEFSDPKEFRTLIKFIINYSRFINSVFINGSLFNFSNSLSNIKQSDTIDIFLNEKFRS